MQEILEELAALRGKPIESLGSAEARRQLTSPTASAFAADAPRAMRLLGRFKKNM